MISLEDVTPASYCGLYDKSMKKQITNFLQNGKRTYKDLASFKSAVVKTGPITDEEISGTTKKPQNKKKKTIEPDVGGIVFIITS